MNKRFFKVFKVVNKEQFLKTIIPDNPALNMKIGTACADSAGRLLNKIREKRNSKTYDSFFSTDYDNIYRHIEISKDDEIKFTIKTLNTFLCFFFYKKPSKYQYAQQHTKEDLIHFFEHIEITKGYENDRKAFHQFLGDLELVKDSLTPLFDQFSIEINEHFEFSIIENDKRERKYEEPNNDTPKPDNIRQSKKFFDYVNMEVKSAEIRARELNIITENKKLPKKLTSIPSINPINVYGRSEDIEELNRLLFEKQQSVLIKGVEGFGKTTLVASYVFKYFEQYDHILYLDVKNTSLLEVFKKQRELRRSLTIDRALTDLDDIFDEIVYMLKQLDGSKKLLVIENADESINPYLEYLPAQPDWHLIVTSCVSLNGLFKYLLKPITLDDAIAIFKKICFKEISEDTISNIIYSCNSHIPMIETCAHLIQNGYFKNQLLKDLHHWKRYRNFFSYSNEIEDFKTIIKPIVDRLNKLQLTEIESKISFIFAIIPHNKYDISFINKFESINQYNTHEALNACNKLVSLGLLENCDENEYEMPLYIQQSVIQRNNLNEKELENIINQVNSSLGILNAVEQKTEQDILEVDYISFGERVIHLMLFGFLSRANIEINKYNELYFNLSQSYYLFGLHQKSLEVIQSFITFNKENKNDDKPLFSIAYLIKARNLHKLQRIQEARLSVSKSISFLKNDAEAFETEFINDILKPLYKEITTLGMDKEYTDFSEFINDKLLTSTKFQSIFKIKDFIEANKIHILMSKGKYLLAIEELKHKENDSRELPKQKLYNIGKYYYLMAECYEKLGDYKTAQKYYNESTTRVNILGQYTAERFNCYLADIRCFIGLKEYQRALVLCNLAIGDYERYEYLVQGKKVDLDYLFGKVYVLLERYDKALEYLNPCIDSLVNKYPKNSMYIANARYYKALALEAKVDWNTVKSNTISTIVNDVYVFAALAHEVYLKLAPEHSFTKNTKAIMDKVLNTGFKATYNGLNRGRIIWKRKD